MKRIRFTLVELLVVIAIIAILASLLLAAVNMAMIRAKKVAAKADALNLKSAIVMFQSDNQRLPTLNGVVDNMVLPGIQYTDLVNVLRGQPNVDSDNKRLRQYLPLARPFESTSQYKCKLVDNYKNPLNDAQFYVVLDTNEDGIQLKDPRDPTNTTFITINEPVLVFWEGDIADPRGFTADSLSAAIVQKVKEDGICTADLP
jgi:prepilin-type N-terminal cleavage/methylation domain-containing protein